MIRTCAYILLVLLILPQGTLLSGAEGPACGLPVLLKRFPGYHLLTLRERDAETRAFVQRRYPHKNPSLVRADFDGDGNGDYAFVLKNDKSAASKLIVFLCLNGQSKRVYEVDVTGYSDLIYLRPVRKGSRVSQTEAISDTEHASSQKLQSAGIEISYFGKGTVVLYWNPKLKRMKEIQTGD